MGSVEGNIGRRDFLKGSTTALAAVASAGLFGCAPESSDSLSQTGAGAEMNYHTVESDLAQIEDRAEWITVDCWHNCGGRCINKALVADGVILRQKSDDSHSDTLEMPQMRACLRGRSQAQQVFNVERLKYPMKRKNWNPGGGANSRGELRGVDEWERISWDEALDLCASEIRRIYADYGARSVLGPAEFADGLLSLMGGCLLYDGTMSYGHWMLCEEDIGTTFGWNLGADMTNTNDRHDMVNADYIVMHGMNPTWSSAGSQSYYFNLAREAGAKFIQIGPSYNVSSSLLEARWIRVRPGSDTAFLLAVAYEMVRIDEEKGDIIDWEFLHKYSVGFDEESMPEDAVLAENFKGYLLGEYDGVPKTPEWATKICETPVEDITWYAEVLGKQNNVMLFHSYSLSRYNGAENLPQLFLTMGCMGGHMGKSGNCCGAAYHAKAGNDGPLLVQYGYASQYSVVANPLEKCYISAPEYWKSILEKKYTYRGFAAMISQTNMFEPEEEIEFDPKMLYLNSGNRMQTYMDTNSAVEAIRSLEFVVSMSYEPTITVQFSDLVLPVTTPWEGNLDPDKGELWLSKSINGLSSRTQREFIMMPQPVTDALYEAKPEEWITVELANRLGLDASELYPISTVQAYFDTLATSTLLDEDGVTWKPLLTITQEDLEYWGVEGTPQEGVIGIQEFLKNGSYHVPVSPGSKQCCIGYKDYIDDPVANPRPSKSGKFEIYCQSKADKLNLMNTDKEPIKPYPTYIRARNNFEDTFTDFDKKTEKSEFPFQMYQPHYLHRSHTEFDNCTWIREAFVSPVFINAEDAKEKGIETGDTVVIFNEKGKILRQASVIEGLMPGCIACPHGRRSKFNWETGIDEGGNENTLLGEGQQSPYFKQAEGYNSCLVDFEKYEGDSLPVNSDRPAVILVEE